MLNEALHQTGQFGELCRGREGHGKVLLMGLLCTLCIFNADASLHLTFNLLCYLLETNLNNYLLPLVIADLSRSIKNRPEPQEYTSFPSVIRRKTNERGKFSYKSFSSPRSRTVWVRVVPVIKRAQNCVPNKLVHVVYISRCCFVRGGKNDIHMEGLAPNRKSG